MSRFIKYTKGEKLGPHNITYIKEEEPAIDSNGKKTRKASFLCPECQTNIFIARIKDVKNGKTRRCSLCRERSISNRFGKDLTNQNFGFLTVLELKKDYQKGHRKGLCQCRCGNKIEVLSDSLISGKTKTCGQKNCPYHSILLGASKIKNLTGQRFGRLIVKQLNKIEPYNITGICNCDCGRENLIFSSKQLLQNKRLSCGCLRSKGENLIEDILKENNISYLREKTFKDCINSKTKHNFRFDFYLPDYNCCIEYDGEQHFKEAGSKNGSSLEENIQKDLIKNKYCKDNNIQIIRIPYTDFETLKNNPNMLLHLINNRKED